MDTNLSESVLWRISQLADRMAASGRIPAPAALVEALMGAMELSEKTKLSLAHEVPNWNWDHPQAMERIYDPMHDADDPRQELKYSSQVQNDWHKAYGDIYRRIGHTTGTGSGYYTLPDQQGEIQVIGRESTFPRTGQSKMLHVLWMPHGKGFGTYKHLPMSVAAFTRWAKKFPPEHVKGILGAAKSALALRANKLARPDYALPFGAKAGTRVGRGLAGGVNKARVVGNYFVKQVTEHGSPHAEEAAGQLREHLGLPSIKIRRAEGPKGEHYMFTDYDPSTRPLSQLDAEDLKPKEVIHNLLADYLTADKDRHNQNYVQQRGRGLVSIDHGTAFHPENEIWGYHNGRPGSEVADSLVSTPELGTHPLEESALHEAWGGHRKEAEADPQVVTKAAGIQHERHLLGLAWAGTEGLPQAERLAAVRAMKNRIRGLRDAIKANGGKVNLNTLRQAEMFALKRITGGH